MAKTGDAPRIETSAQALALGKARKVRPKGDGQVVRARLAELDGVIVEGERQFRYRAGEHYLVAYPDGSQSAVRRDIFQRTYRRVTDGVFRKRTDVILTAVVAPHAIDVATLEGVVRAEPGDWIMIGTCGEIWPVSPSKAQEKYALAGIGAGGVATLAIATVAGLAAWATMAILNAPGHEVSALVLQ